MHENRLPNNPLSTTRDVPNQSTSRQTMKTKKLGQPVGIDNKIVYQSIPLNKNKSLRLLRNKIESSVNLDRPITLSSRNQQKTSKSLVELHKNGSIRFSRDEKIALYLSPELQKFSDDHKLRQKNPQIRYVKTLKKIKKTGDKLGCSVRAKTEGVELQLSKDLQQEASRELRFALKKQFDRYLRKKIVNKSNDCC